MLLEAAANAVISETVSCARRCAAPVRRIRVPPSTTSRNIHFKTFNPGQLLATRWDRMYTASKITRQFHYAYEKISLPAPRLSRSYPPSLGSPLPLYSRSSSAVPPRRSLCVALERFSRGSAWKPETREAPTRNRDETSSSSLFSKVLWKVALATARAAAKIKLILYIK